MFNFHFPLKKNLFLQNMRCFAISNKILFSLFLVVAFCILSCKQREIDPLTAEFDALDDDYIQPAVEIFMEPEDLSISYQKARNFNKASEALAIMGLTWAEKMSEIGSEEQLKMAAAYEKAQDDLIRKFGIMGKEEFKWIQTKALPEPTNFDVFSRAGVWIKR
jgi:hypothetical protein